MDYGHEQTDKELKKLEKRITEEYEKAYKEVKQKADDYFAKFQKADAEKKKLVDSGLMSKKDYLAWRKSAMLTGKRWDDMADVLAKDMVNADKIAASVIGERLPDTYALNANYGTYEIEGGLGIDTSWTMYDHSTVENLMRDDPQMIPKPRVDIPKDMRWNRQKITSAITQGVLQGDSIPDIAKRLRSVTNMDRSAALRNARTYTTAAENKGRIDSYQRAKELGIDLQKEWMSTPDGRTRDSHVDLDGERVEIDGTFSNGCRYPADPIGDPAEVYNCRCTLVAAVKGRQYHDDRFTRLPEGMTYEDWKANRLKAEGESGDESRHVVVNGEDISATWVRRQDKFDFAIDDIINAQGFDGLPKILSGDEFNEAVKDSKYHGYRGYSAPNNEVLEAYKKQLYEGKWYVDCSVGTAAYGQGMYTQGYVNGDDSSDFISKAIAEGYGKSRNNPNYRVEEMTLSSDAKGISLYKHSGDLTDVNNYSEFHMEYMKKNASGEWDDIGVYAAAKGYDYIYFYDDAGTQEVIILNRTKVIIKGE